MTTGSNEGTLPNGAEDGMDALGELFNSPKDKREGAKSANFGFFPRRGILSEEWDLQETLVVTPSDVKAKL